jgi:hypothetical protein
VRIGILHRFDGGVEMNPTLAQTLKRAGREADSLIGAPRLTYCQLERQIPTVVSGSGAGWDAKLAVSTGKVEPERSRAGYRYPASNSSPIIRVSSSQHLARRNVLKVNA